MAGSKNNIDKIKKIHRPSIFFTTQNGVYLCHIHIPFSKYIDIIGYYVEYKLRKEAKAKLET